MDKYTDSGYFYIKTSHSYVDGAVGKDIKLTFAQKIRILFAKGISIVFVGKKEET